MTKILRVEPIWLDSRDALAIHDRQIAEHGGLPGVRDLALLDSALARPVNKWEYGEEDRCALAAAYAYGIARNHPFSDGNKRTAWVMARLYLALNDIRIVFLPQDAIAIVLALVEGELPEDELAIWFREHIPA